MSRTYYLMVHGETCYVERDNRVIQRLVENSEIDAYQVDTTVKPPKLTRATLGKKHKPVATVAIRDLEVDGESVAEQQVQENVETEE